MARSSVSADMLHLSLKQLGATKIQSSTSITLKTRKKYISRGSNHIL